MYKLGNFDAEPVFTALDLSILEVSVDQPNEAFVVDGIDGSGHSVYLSSKHRKETLWRQPVESIFLLFLQIQF